YGILDYVALLKHIEQKEKPIKNITNRQYPVFKGSSPVEGILKHPLWQNTPYAIIVGQHNYYLGILTSNTLKSIKAKIKKPQITQDKESAIKEYLHFTDLVWKSLNKFWSSIT